MTNKGTEESEQHHFKRALGFWDATMIVAGSMIGSGIFIVSADMSRTVGSTGWLLLLWVLSGVITLMAALSYGELAGMMPKAGGQFVYIERAYALLDRSGSGVGRRHLTQEKWLKGNHSCIYQ